MEYILWKYLKNLFGGFELSAVKMSDNNISTNASLLTVNVSNDAYFLGRTLSNGSFELLSTEEAPAIPSITVLSTIPIEHQLHFDKEPFVHPLAVSKLLTCLADSAPVVTSVDLHGVKRSNEFSDKPINFTDEAFPFVRCDLSSGGSEGYQYIGKTDTYIHALLTASSGGGSGVFYNILLFVIQQVPQARTGEPNEPNGIYMTRLGEIGLGDRPQITGGVKIYGNDLVIGELNFSPRPEDTSPEQQIDLLKLFHQ